MIAVVVLFLATQPVDLAQGWQARDARTTEPWVDVTFPEKPNARVASSSPIVEYRRSASLGRDGKNAGDRWLVLPFTVGDVDIWVDDNLIGTKTQSLPAAFPLPIAATADGHVDVRLVLRLHETFARTVPHVPRIDEGPLLITGRRAAEDAVTIARLERRVRVELPQLGFALVLLLAGLYHLLLWALRRQLDSYFVYAVFLLLFSAWAWIVGAGGTTGFGAMSVPDMWRWAPGLGAFAAAFFLEFVFRFLRGTRPTRFFVVGEVFIVVTSLLCFVPGTVGFWFAGSPARIVPFVVIMGGVLGVIAKEAWRGNRDARTIVAGFGLLSLLVLRLLLGQLGVIEATTKRYELLGFACLVGSMAAALARRYARTLEELDQTNAAITRFVPFKFLSLLQKQSVREIARGDNVKLEMSVMFCDIRGFTTLAEAAGADATFRQINRYLAVMEPEIHKEGGYINQYMGDGIMSLFHTSTDKVLRASIGMTTALRALNEERAKRDEPPLKIGIGINTGSLMLGTIGGGEQLDSGVVGDAANLAARVEGMTKQYAVTVLVADATAKAVPTTATFRLRELDTVVAKGKKTAITIHELLDAEEADVAAAKASSLSTWNEGLAKYRAGEFAAAAVCFSSCLQACPNDGPAQVMLDRCNAWAASPPSSWTGVTELASK